MLAGYALLLGAIHLPPFVTSPIQIWGWQNWLFGFAPAAYLVFASVIAVLSERAANRIPLLSLPLILSPLLLVSGLIVFATYVDFANTVSGAYSWSQNLHSLLIASLCPVIWYYQFATTRRSWRMIRTNNGG